MTSNYVLRSPGQYDVDCGNGSEVCCFDGCVNRCGRPKVCKTIYKVGILVKKLVINSFIVFVTLIILASGLC